LCAGFKEITNISGGYTSIQRQARTTGFTTIEIDLLPVELKSLKEGNSVKEEKSKEETEVKPIDMNSLIVIDVRSTEEFKSGAYPDAINIPLDELTNRLDELGSNRTREIVVYCASGGRSAYAQRMLEQVGYTHVKNGGGIASMMASRNAKPPVTSSSNEPLVVDVRTPEEFRTGAYPGAVNIPLDELQIRIIELGSKTREITLYCASGARSAYGLRGLQQLGFSNVKNGGGIMQMMRQR